MKKLSFVLAILFVSFGMAIAQIHVSNVTETGVDHSAVITQSGPGDIISNVTQSNANNVATVDQVNKKLQADNKLLSNIFQTGMNNKSTVEQTHDGDLASRAGLLEALTVQTGNDNEAIQIQGPHSQMGTGYVEVIQGGSENYAYQIQVKYGNSAKINQSGDRNIAKQAQDIMLPLEAEGSMNTAIIDQSGNYNTAEQTQNGWANEAYAFQSGSDNSSVQNQGVGTPDSWVNFALVSQSGNSNEAEQTQNGRLNRAKIDQASNCNDAVQTQLSEGTRENAVYMVLNNAEIYQMGGSCNVATQYQYLPGLEGEQSNYMEATDANVAIAWQDGGLNTSTQTQTGGYNYSSVSQTGFDHTATATQSLSIIQ